MQVEPRAGDYKSIVCDLLAFPVFEEETLDSPVLQDLDFAIGPGRLVAVTIVNHANTGPGYENLLATRKAAAAGIAGPLQQKSATEFVASGPGCQLRLLPNADTWFINEVYQLPN